MPDDVMSAHVMPEADRTELERAVGEIEKIHAVLGAARRLTQENRAVDLSAVDARLGALCARVDSLPRATARTLKPALTALADELDRLGEDLAARFGGLPSLGDLASAGDAADAYGSATKHFP
ncbi:MAG: hypothetical protein SFV21_19070 [Rhodospirillaceae bacterium]|nr:hypothetical protein [Rhodospirillaceae bacterium]